MSKSKQRLNARAVVGVKSAQQLVNPISSSILRLLARRELALSDLSRELGLSKSRISYHLAQLEKTELIEWTREEIYRGGVRKFYRSVVSLQLPRLSVLSRAEKETILLPIKMFLWGYLWGKFKDAQWDFEKFTGSKSDEYAHMIEETIEQMIVKGKGIGEDMGDLLYLKLLINATLTLIKKDNIKVEQLGLKQPKKSA